MAPTNHYLVTGSMPLVGRAYEASAQAELAGAGTTPPRRPASGLPFIDGILSHIPGDSIAVARRLRLDEDLFLQDHHFVHAPGVKTLDECYPVVPMTVSLEMMAEAAACLAPGDGLLGFEQVTARRWIAVAEQGELDLTIKGRMLAAPAPSHPKRIAMQVLVGAKEECMIEATVLFNKHYDSAPPPQPGAVRASRTIDAERLYGERHLFHGPRFQCLRGPVQLLADGACGQARVRATQDWFASSQQPQLLCDPGLLDTVGQLLAVWSAQDGNAAFPVGLARLDLYGATPPAGTLLPISLRVTGRQLKMISADVEIGDGTGGVWLRISGWRSWQFKWAPQLVSFQRQPFEHALSETRACPSATGASYQRMSAQTIAGFDLALLARHYLRASEMNEFDAKARYPKRQLEWLLGRIAAKDAVRVWSARVRSAPLDLHPAAFTIQNDAGGQPTVASWPANLAFPHISIAHSNGVAIAIADGAPVGIDIEPVAGHDAHFLKNVTTEAERQQMAAYAEPERTEWITRLWCAKEAFAKRLGHGINRSGQDFEALACTAGHSLRMCHALSGTCTDVRTLRDGDFIVAIDGAGPAHPSKEAP